MRELRYTLVSDGSFDRALLRILSWLLVEQQVLVPIQAEWADLRWLRDPPKGIASRIRLSLDLYPCDLLFMHRDSERQSYAQRKAEIIRVLADIGPMNTPSVCVVPVRMLEAWLLFNEAALRRAAGNPNGQTPLELPDPARLEQKPDPKSLLFDLLKVASGLTGHRLRKFRASQHAEHVADYINDFAQLRTLPAFRELEADVGEIVILNQWAAPL